MSLLQQFFIKPKKKMKEHISCCTGQTVVSFDNGKIIDYQDNFKKLEIFLLQSITTLRQLPVAWYFLMRICLCSAIVL